LWATPTNKPLAKAKKFNFEVALVYLDTLACSQTCPPKNYLKNLGKNPGFSELPLKNLDQIQDILMQRITDKFQVIEPRFVRF
jgi:hypothetical protein